MKNTFLAASALALALSTTATADERKSKSKSSTSTMQQGGSGSMGAPGSVISGTGGSGTTTGRQLASDSIGKAVEMSSAISFYTPEEMKWTDAPPSLPRGAKLAVLEGDPSQPNKHYAIRLRFPANYRVAPHYHPADERITVLSGGLSVGHGDKWDATQMKTFQPMGFYAFPAGMSHFVQARSETVLEVAGVGPFELVYINPSDDPRNRGTGGAGNQGSKAAGSEQTGQPVKPRR